MVSSHFGYTEDYVLHKTPFWLNRKFKQADREMYENRRMQADGIQRGITIVLDVVFNNGKEADKIMPSYEEALKRLQEHKEENNKDKFVTTMWWKPKHK